MNQRFKSTKSGLFITVVILVIIFTLIISIANFTKEDAGSRTFEYSGNLLELLVLMYVYSIMIFSYIEIDDKLLKLRVGFSVKKIDIDSIRALKSTPKKNILYGAGTQLIIQYNKYDEIMFYPADKAALIKAIHDLKPEIIVSES